MEATKNVNYDKKKFTALKLVNCCNIDRVSKISVSREKKVWALGFSNIPVYKLKINYNTFSVKYVESLNRFYLNTSYSLG